jgi:hypothetical protein
MSGRHREPRLGARRKPPFAQTGTLCRQSAHRDRDGRAPRRASGGNRSAWPAAPASRMRATVPRWAFSSRFPTRRRVLLRAARDRTGTRGSAASRILPCDRLADVAAQKDPDEHPVLRRSSRRVRSTCRARLRGLRAQVLASSIRALVGVVVGPWCVERASCALRKWSLTRVPGDPEQETVAGLETRCRSSRCPQRPALVLAQVLRRFLVGDVAAFHVESQTGPEIAPPAGRAQASSSIFCSFLDVVLGSSLCGCETYRPMTEP